jgi:hypothetical protein
MLPFYAAPRAAFETVVARLIAAKVTPRRLRWLRASLNRILNHRHPEGLAKSNEGNAAEKFKERCAVQATNRADLGNTTVGGYLGCSGRAANDAAVEARARARIATGGFMSEADTAARAGAL